MFCAKKEKQSMKISIKKVFENRDSAAEFAMNRLRTKYSVNFAVNQQNSEVYQEYQYKTVFFFTADCVDKENYGKECTVWITDMGEEMDDFAAHYVRDEAEFIFSEILKSESDIRAYKTDFVGTRTSAVVPADVTLKDYTSKYKTARVNCTVSLAEGLDEKAYAKQINGIVGRLLPLGIPFELRVTDGKTDIFLYLFDDNKNSLTSLELEIGILDNMRHTARIAR
jgi:hypothetical protein